MLIGIKGRYDFGAPSPLSRNNNTVSAFSLAYVFILLDHLSEISSLPENRRVNEAKWPSDGPRLLVIN